MRKQQKSFKQMCDNSIQGLATIKKMELRKGELNTKLLERRLVQKSNLPDAFLKSVWGATTILEHSDSIRY